MSHFPGWRIQQLERIREQYQTTERRRYQIEARPEFTDAVVDGLFAIAYTRLGRPDAGRGLLAEASKQLTSDEIHSALLSAIAYRIDQVEAGHPTTPLAGSAAAPFNDLGLFSAYKADRCRSVSRVVNPLERLDPVGGFTAGLLDSRGEVFVSLRGAHDAAHRASILAAVADSKVELGAPALSGAIAFCSTLEPSDAHTTLSRLVERLGRYSPADQISLAADAVDMAALLQIPDVGNAAVNHFLAAVPSVELDAFHSPDLATVRLLDSVAGLGGDQQRIVAALAARELPNDAESIAALNIVAAQCRLTGDFGGMIPRIQACVRGLDRPRTHVRERIRLTRALGLSATTIRDPSHSITIIDSLLPQLEGISDPWNTNSHYCLSVVEFMDAIVDALCRVAEPADAGFTLLERIRDRPEDREARAVYADVLEQTGDIDRALFVQLQLRRHLTPDQRLECIQLLEHHQNRWLGPILHAVRDVEWERGFPVAARLTADLDAVRAAQGHPTWATFRDIRLGRSRNVDPIEVIGDPAFRSLEQVLDVTSAEELVSILGTRPIRAVRCIAGPDWHPPAGGLRVPFPNQLCELHLPQADVSWIVRAADLDETTIFSFLPDTGDVERWLSDANDGTTRHLVLYTGHVLYDFQRSQTPGRWQVLVCAEAPLLTPAALELEPARHLIDIVDYRPGPPQFPRYPAPGAQRLTRR